MIELSDEDREWLADREYIRAALKDCRSRLGHKYEEVTLLSDRIVELEAVVRELSAKLAEKSGPLQPINLSESEVVGMLQLAKTEAEWQQVVEKVKSAFGGVLPDYWDAAEKRAFKHSQRSFIERLVDRL
jgi:chromosome segregation ATPase